MIIRDKNGRYHTPTEGLTADELEAEAAGLITKRWRRGKTVQSPADTKHFFALRLADKKSEVFACLFLDTRHRILEYNEMFHGTINEASVHPREIVRRALELNAAVVILAHNHPSGSTEPSRADIALTTRLKSALDLIDVRVLDHIVVGAGETLSFAEIHLI